WGLALGGVFWVSDNGTGLSTLYDAEGNPQSLVVTIPPSVSNKEHLSAPTGQVFNSGTGFVVSNGTTSGPAIFIFASEDGGISGWNPEVSPNQAIMAVDHGAENAIYKGLTIATDANGDDHIYASNFWSARVEIYDSAFTETDTSSTFVDP